jgi:pimeloyl-ACP methyl ester carboxylesterase
VKGGRIHLVDRAAADPAAPVVVLLHGASGNSRDMISSLGDRLAGRYRVVALDRPGHGWSDRPEGRADASPARQAALIRQALDEIGVTRAIVLGHSWSGALATALALDHAELVSGLVLLAPVTHPWPGGVTWYYGPASSLLVGTVFTSTLATPIGSAVLEPAIAGVFHPNTPPADYADRSGAWLVLRPAEFRANAQDVQDLLGFVQTQAGRYGEIAVPTSIIHGEDDRTVSPVIHSRALAAQVAGARLILLPGVGHMPHHTNPDIVIGEIDRVAALPSPAAARHAAVR